jgi:uncharacterized membrane protein YbhN (UPF0104 family)
MAMLAVRYLASVQMAAILQAQSIDLDTVRVFLINLITGFYGLFLPGYLSGGVIRWYFFSIPGGKRAQAAAAIIINRLLETVMLSLVGISFWLIDYTAKATVEALQLMATLGVVLSASYVASFTRAPCIFLKHLMRGRWCPRILESKANKVLDALVRYQDQGVIWHVRISGLCLLRNLIGIVALYVLATAIDLNVSVWTLGWIRSVIRIVLMIPVSFAGLGVREASFVLLLAPVGVASPQALALSVLVFAQALLFALIGMLLEFNRMFLNSSRVKGGLSVGRRTRELDDHRS